MRIEQNNKINNTNMLNISKLFDDNSGGKILLRNKRSSNEQSALDDNNYRTLVEATDTGHFNYWLREYDISHIARLEYGYTENSVTETFRVTSQQAVNRQVSNFMQSGSNTQIKPLILIINTNPGTSVAHWVTLIISFSAENSRGYYIDSVGTSIPKNIKNVLTDNSIAIEDLSFLQQADSYNCGLWALKNAHNVIESLRQNQVSPDDIKKRLRTITLNGENERKHLVRLLKADPDWNYFVNNILPSISVDDHSSLSGSQHKTDLSDSFLSIPASLVAFGESEEIIETLLQGVKENNIKSLEAFKSSFINFWKTIPIIHTTTEPRFFLYLMLASLSTLGEASLNKGIGSISFKLKDQQLYCVLHSDSNDLIAAIVFSYKDETTSYGILQEFVDLNSPKKYEIVLEKTSEGSKSSIGSKKINFSLQSKEIMPGGSSLQDTIENGWYPVNIDTNRKLSDLVNQMSNSNLETDVVQNYFQKVNEHYKKIGDLFIKDDVNKEYPYQAVHSGIMLNFKKRFLVDIHVERRSGKGYVDFSFIVRRNSDNRVNYDSAIPIISELKNPRVALESADRQSEEEGYAKSRFPARTSSSQAILVSANPTAVRCKTVNILPPSNAFVELLEAWKWNTEEEVKKTEAVYYPKKKAKAEEGRPDKYRQKIKENFLLPPYQSFKDVTNTESYYSLLLLGHLVSLPSEIKLGKSEKTSYFIQRKVHIGSRETVFVIDVTNNQVGAVGHPIVVYLQYPQRTTRTGQSLSPGLDKIGHIVDSTGDCTLIKIEANFINDDFENTFSVEFLDIQSIPAVNGKSPFKFSKLSDDKLIKRSDFIDRDNNYNEKLFIDYQNKLFNFFKENRFILNIKSESDYQALSQGLLTGLNTQDQTEEIRVYQESNLSQAGTIDLLVSIVPRQTDQDPSSKKKTKVNVFEFKHHILKREIKKTEWNGYINQLTSYIENLKAVTDINTAKMQVIVYCPLIDNNIIQSSEVHYASVVHSSHLSNLQDVIKSSSHGSLKITSEEVNNIISKIERNNFPDFENTFKNQVLTTTPMEQGKQVVRRLYVIRKQFGGGGAFDTKSIFDLDNLDYFVDNPLNDHAQTIFDTLPESLSLPKGIKIANYNFKAYILGLLNKLIDSDVSFELNKLANIFRSILPFKSKKLLSDVCNLINSPKLISKLKDSEAVAKRDFISLFMESKIGDVIEIFDKNELLSIIDKKSRSYQYLETSGLNLPNFKKQHSINDPFINMDSDWKQFSEVIDNPKYSMEFIIRKTNKKINNDIKKYNVFKHKNDIQFLKKISTDNYFQDIGEKNRQWLIKNLKLFVRNKKELKQFLLTIEPENSNIISGDFFNINFNQPLWDLALEKMVSTIKDGKELSRFLKGLQKHTQVKILTYKLSSASKLSQEFPDFIRKVIQTQKDFSWIFPYIYELDDFCKEKPTVLNKISSIDDINELTLVGDKKNWIHWSTNNQYDLNIEQIADLIETVIVYYNEIIEDSKLKAPIDVALLKFIYGNRYQESLKNKIRVKGLLTKIPNISEEFKEILNNIPVNKNYLSVDNYQPSPTEQKIKPRTIKEVAHKIAELGLDSVNNKYKNLLKKLINSPHDLNKLLAEYNSYLLKTILVPQEYNFNQFAQEYSGEFMFADCIAYLYEEYFETVYQEDTKRSLKTLHEYASEIVREAVLIEAWRYPDYLKYKYINRYVFERANQLTNEYALAHVEDRYLTSYVEMYSCIYIYLYANPEVQKKLRDFAIKIFELLSENKFNDKNFIRNYEDARSIIDYLYAIPINDLNINKIKDLKSKHPILALPKFESFWEPFDTHMLSSPTRKRNLQEIAESDDFNTKKLRCSRSIGVPCSIDYALEDNKKLIHDLAETRKKGHIVSVVDVRTILLGLIKVENPTRKILVLDNSMTRLERISHIISQVKVSQTREAWLERVKALFPKEGAVLEKEVNQLSNKLVNFAQLRDVFSDQFLFVKMSLDPSRVQDTSVFHQYLGIGEEKISAVYLGNYEYRMYDWQDTKKQAFKDNILALLSTDEADLYRISALDNQEKVTLYRGSRDYLEQKWILPAMPESFSDTKQGLQLLKVAQEWSTTIVQSSGLNAEWIPILKTAQKIDVATEQMDFIHFKTYEVRTIEFSGHISTLFLEHLSKLYKEISDTIFSKAGGSEFLGSPIESAEGVDGLNAAFTVQAVFDLVKQKDRDRFQSEQASPLATALQIHHDLNLVQIAHGTFVDVSKVVDLVKTLLRNGINLETKPLSMVSSVGLKQWAIEGPGILLNFASVVLDSIELSKVKTEAETATFSTQLAFDAGGLSLSVVSMGAAYVGASTTAALLGVGTVILSGLGIGITSLVQAFSKVVTKAQAVGTYFFQLNNAYQNNGYQKQESTQNNQFVMSPLYGAVVTEINFQNGTIHYGNQFIYRTHPRSRGVYGSGNANFISWAGDFPGMVHDKEQALNIRSRLGYPQEKELGDWKAILTWILPDTTISYISYDWINLPGATTRKDKGFSVLRKLEERGDFDYDFYIFPSEYIIHSLHEERVLTPIKIFLDGQERTFIVPPFSKNEQEIYKQLHYQFEGPTSKGRCSIILNRMGSLTLNSQDDRYTWVLVTEDFAVDDLEFTSAGLKLGNDISVYFSSPHSGNYVLVDKNAVTSNLDLNSQKTIPIEANFQLFHGGNFSELKSYLKERSANTTAAIIVNDFPLQDEQNVAYNGTAFYLPQEDRYVCTKNLPEAINKKTRFVGCITDSCYFLSSPNLLWCTHSQTGEIRKKYVLYSDILIDSKSRIQKNYSHQIASAQVQPDGTIHVTQVFKDANEKIIRRATYHLVQNKLLLFSLEDDHIAKILHKDEDKEEQTRHIKSFFNAKTDQKAQKTYNKLAAGSTSVAKIDTLVMVKPFSQSVTMLPVWVRKKDQDHYQLINPHIVEKSLLFLGTLLAPGDKEVFYFLSPSKQDNLAKLFRQQDEKSNARLLDLAIKNAFWSNRKLFVLTAEGVIRDLNALGNSTIVGFSAEWTESHSRNWWLKVSSLLATESNTTKRYITIYGITDQVGKNLGVWYNSQSFIFVQPPTKPNGEQFHINYLRRVANIDFFYSDNGILYQQTSCSGPVSDYFQGTQLQKRLPELIPLANSLQSAYFYQQRLWIHQNGLIFSFIPQLPKTWFLERIEQTWFDQNQNNYLLQNETAFGQSVKTKLTAHYKTDFFDNKLLTPIDFSHKTHPFVISHKRALIPLELPNGKRMWWNPYKNSFFINSSNENISDWVYLGECSNIYLQDGACFFSRQAKMIYFNPSYSIYQYKFADKNEIPAEVALSYNDAFLLVLRTLPDKKPFIPLLKDRKFLNLYISRTDAYKFTVPEEVMKHYETVFFQINHSVENKLFFSWEGEGTFLAQKNGEDNIAFISPEGMHRWIFLGAMQNETQNPFNGTDLNIFYRILNTTKVYHESMMNIQTHLLQEEQIVLNNDFFRHSNCVESYSRVPVAALLSDRSEMEMREPIQGKIAFQKQQNHQANWFENIPTPIRVVGTVLAVLTTFGVTKVGWMFINRFRARRTAAAVVILAPEAIPLKGVDAVEVTVPTMTDKELLVAMVFSNTANAKFVESTTKSSGQRLDESSESIQTAVIGGTNPGQPTGKVYSVSNSTAKVFKHFYEPPTLECPNNPHDSKTNQYVKPEYNGHMVNNIYLVKWLFFMFGKHAVVNRMNQSEQILANNSHGSMSRFDWSMNQLKQGIDTYGNEKEKAKFDVLEEKRATDSSAKVSAQKRMDRKNTTPRFFALPTSSSSFVNGSSIERPLVTRGN